MPVAGRDVGWPLVEGTGGDEVGGWVQACLGKFMSSVIDWRPSPMVIACTSLPVP